MSEPWSKENIRRGMDEVSAPRCLYCHEGFDRHAWTGGSLIHVLTRDAEGRIVASRPCTRS